MGSDKERSLQPFAYENEPVPFSTLRLRDLYGDYSLKPGTTIVTDIPNDNKNAVGLSDDRKKLRELADRYGLISIGSLSYGGFGTPWQKPFVEISAGMGPPKANWVPQVFERGAILALAHSISGSRQPLVMDVGCGGGISSKLIGVDGEANVVGVDPYQKKHETLGELSEDVQFRNTNLFRQIGNFGPHRTRENLDRTNEIIKMIYDSFKDAGSYYFWAMQHGMGMQYKDFPNEVRELQKLSHKAERTSPVDIVLCSFMPTGTDLTLAIRDGIRPKAIVYVKPMNGLSGVGDFYQGPQRGVSDKVISFNPGRDYRTVARWQTFWDNEWSHEVYDFELGSNPAEVVVQVRNDIKLRPSDHLPVVQTFPFDREIVNVIRKHKSDKYHKHNFYEGLVDEQFILDRSRVTLPYRMD